MENSGKPKVLIVDDTPENIQVLMGTLKGDYAIVAAVNGEKALKLAAAEPRPEIILLDIMMPGMDGFEVCRRLKAGDTTNKVKVTAELGFFSDTIHAHVIKRGWTRRVQVTLYSVPDRQRQA